MFVHVYKWANHVNSFLSSYEVAIASAQDPNYTVIPVYNREKVWVTYNNKST